jgi:alpha-beta hydrolase superfamily lysophospholipase
MLRNYQLLLIGAIALASTLASSPAALSLPHAKLDCDLGRELNLPVTEWVDDTSPKSDKGIIVAVHGLTLYAGAFDDVARHLVSIGYKVYALDMRGFGRWCQEGPKYGGDKEIHVGESQTDLLRLVQTIRGDNPQGKLFFLGESQGTNLSMWVIENHPGLTDGAILVSPCYHTRVHPTFRWLVDASHEIFTPTKPLNLEPYTRPYLTNDPVLTEKCDKDPLVNREMTPTELVKCLLENRHAIKNASRIPARYPILMLAGTKDGVFKSKGLPKEVKKFGDAKSIELTLLPGKGHLLIEHQPLNQEIAALMDNWLAEQTQANESKLSNQGSVE